MEQPQTRQQGTQRGAVHPALTPRQQERNWLPFTSAVQETMKTSDLQGAALAWAVAKCEGLEMQICGGGELIEVPGWEQYAAFSTNWAQGGPIIEREKIDVWTHADKEWAASVDKGRNEFRGRTPLIAAMRCYVASKLGDEVEIPEGLK